MVTHRDEDVSLVVTGLLGTRIIRDEGIYGKRWVIRAVEVGDNKVDIGRSMVGVMDYLSELW